MPRFQENSVFTFGKSFHTKECSYTPGNGFKACPVCGCKSLRKNISGKHYCGVCKRVIDV